MSSNKDATSTPQSYMDKATGAVQSAIGSLTGSTADKVSLSIANPRSRFLTHHRPKAKTAKMPPPLNTTSPTPPRKPDPSP